MKQDKVVSDLWIQDLLKSYQVRKLSDLSLEALDEEISLAHIAMENCRNWHDELGVLENRNYMLRLLDAKREIQQNEPNEYITEDDSELTDTYEVGITETFWRTINVRSVNEDTALRFVKEKYNNGSIVLGPDYYWETEFDLIGDSW